MGIPNYLEQDFRRSDGSWHKLSVSSYPDEYGSYENIDISVDHETSSFNDLWYYSGKIYLVRAANGANYIYASLHADNDYSFLVVYDLYRRPYKVGEIQGAFDTDYERASKLQMADGSCFCAFSHPEHYTMSTIIQYMSTVSGEREYEPGADGMPRPLTPYYEVDFVRELTAKVDLTLPSVTYSEDDPSLAGVTGGNVEIKAGEKLAFWRTDGDNYMDLKREDGSAVRCVLDESMGWPYYVNGVALESAFDGIIFAG